MLRDSRKRKIIDCESKKKKHMFFFRSRTPQTMDIFLDIPIAGRQCLYVSGKVVLWPKHFVIMVPMFYLKLRNHICIYIYIYITA